MIDIFESDSGGASTGTMRRLTRIYYMGSHWCNLANMTETSMCGGNAAFCQITPDNSYCYYKMVCRKVL